MKNLANVLAVLLLVAALGLIVGCGCGTTNNQTEEEMVVYRALYGEGETWVRPLSMWNDTVTREGKTYRRFAPVD